MLPAFEVRSSVALVWNSPPYFAIWRECSRHRRVSGTASRRSGSIGFMQISQGRDRFIMRGPFCKRQLFGGEAHPFSLQSGAIGTFVPSPPVLRGGGAGGEGEGVRYPTPATGILHCTCFEPKTGRSPCTLDSEPPAPLPSPPAP